MQKFVSSLLQSKNFGALPLFIMTKNGKKILEISMFQTYLN